MANDLPNTAKSYIEILRRLDQTKERERGWILGFVYVFEPHSSFLSGTSYLRFPEFIPSTSLS